MHAADDGVYHVQLRGTIPSCTFIIQRNVSLDQTSSGSAGSVRVIDGELFIFTAPFLFMQHLHILSSEHNTCDIIFCIPMYIHTRGVCMAINTVCFSRQSLHQSDLSARRIHFLLQFPTISGRLVP